MPSPKLILSLLFVACFGLAAGIERWWVGWEGNRSNESLMEVALGDGRRLFANHFYLKADAYFHSGFYPTIFDAPLDEGENAAMAQEAGATKGKRKELPGPGAARDWVERFGRNFYPSVHTHLDMGGSHNHDHDHDHDHGEGMNNGAEMIREILPWLKVSAEMNPERIETYTVAAYWLRTRMGKVEEAHELLGDGLRANPDSYEILFELGRIHDGHFKDTARARQLWERAFRKWEEQEPAKPEEVRNYFLLAQICSHLAFLEDREGNLEAAIRHMQSWKGAAPNPDSIQARIDILEKRLANEKQR